MNDIVIDWELVGNKETTKGNNDVLVMAIPKAVIGQYKTIAESCGLELTALEAEVLGLKRALIKPNDPVTCLVEIGYQSTNISMVDNGYVKSSISYDMAGKDLTFAISETLGVDISQAEEMKRMNGLDSKTNIEVSDALVPVLAIIADKTKKMIKEFEAKEGKRVEKILLSGGGSRMNGILNFFRVIFGEDEYFKNLKVLIGDAFYKIDYYPKLESKVRDINAYFSIAIGEGLRRFEK
jgi:type IV pilus assembly protein PilM